MPEKKKKIIYLVTQAEWGGAQKYVFDLAAKLPEEEFEVNVAAGDGDGQLFKKLEAANIPYFKLKHTVRAISPWHDFLAFFELLKLFKQERPYIIHLNSSKISILASLAGKIFKIRNSKLNQNSKFKIIYTVHGWVFTEPLPVWQKKIYYFAEKWTAGLKDKIIAVSEADKQIALKHNFAAPDKIITIHNGTDLKPADFFDKPLAKEKLTKLISNKLILSPYSLIIGVIANLYPTKGLEYLIEAAAILIKSYPDLLFLVIGDGNEKSNYQSLILNHQLSNNFFLLGTIDEAYRYLKAFDVFVLPSVKEGFPYTAVEALAAGVPIVATNVGGLPEIITDGINGLLVPPAAPEALARAIKRLLDNPDFTAKLKQNALASSARFTLKNMVDKTITIYK